MTKGEFRILFTDTLKNQGIDIEGKKVVSALAKTARHIRNRDGEVTWDESELDNAIYFYNEFNKQDTFNRNTFRINQ